MLRQLLINAPKSARALLIKSAAKQHLADTAALAAIRESLPPHVLEPFDALLSALREW